MKITKENYAIVDRDTHIGKWVEESKRLDFDQNALPTYLPFFKRNGVLLNIGANIGCYAYAFIKFAKEILCFEPNLESFECLKYNLQRYNNVKLFQNAVSNEKTKYIVRNDFDNVGMTYIEEDVNSSLETIVVDDLDLQELDFILMDCEGYELNVLKGAEKTINKFHPIIVLEINDATLNRLNITRKEIFNWLKEHNYKFRNIYKSQGLNDPQLDIICFPNV